MNNVPSHHADAAAPRPWPREDLTALTGTETILVIEDDAQICALLARGLQALGYHVHTVRSGAEAMAFYATSAGAIDVVLCDVILPDMPGPSVLARIGAAHPGLVLPPVVFMSGYPGGALVEAGKLTDADHFIQKPIRRSAVAMAVRQVLDA